MLFTNENLLLQQKIIRIDEKFYVLPILIHIYKQIELLKRDRKSNRSPFDQVNKFIMSLLDERQSNQIEI